MTDTFLLVLDEGTTSARAVVFDARGEPVAMRQRPVPCAYPAGGWVEQDAELLWTQQLGAARDVIEQTGIEPRRIAGLGIANQRETVVVWDRASGKPVYPAIVWQDRRTADALATLRASGVEPMVQERTGLLLDPYFSASKVAWILDHVPGARPRAMAGELAMGTVDSWLVWNLTGGRTHVVEVSNASRTLLLHRTTLTWDAELLRIFDLPEALLPEVVPTLGTHAITDPAWLGAALPVIAVQGDQQAALFGHGAVEAGRTKVTYGTGAFVMRSVGERSIPATHGLLSTVAWQHGTHVTYALEGSVLSAGSVVEWLKNGLGLLPDAAQVDAYARSAKPRPDVWFVPALTGLGTPHWDPHVRGTLLGLDPGITPPDIVAAALRGLAHQVADVLEAMDGAAPPGDPTVTCDGGLSRSDALLALQANVAGVPIVRLAEPESTARGVALEAGIALGWWDLGSIPGRVHRAAAFAPQWDATERARERQRWHEAIALARTWHTGGPNNDP